MPLLNLDSPQHTYIFPTLPIKCTILWTGLWTNLEVVHRIGNSVLCCQIYEASLSFSQSACVTALSREDDVYVKCMSIHFVWSIKLHWIILDMLHFYSIYSWIHKIMIWLHYVIKRAQCCHVPQTAYTIFSGSNTTRLGTECPIKVEQ